MTLVTITGQYGVADGASHPSGYVDLAPILSMALGKAVITQAPVRCVLVDGAFSATVYGSNDPGWKVAPEKMPYEIREVIDGRVTAVWIAYIDGPGPVDMSDLIPLQEVPSFPDQGPDLSGYQLRSEKDQPRGYLGLDDQGRVESPEINAATLTGPTTVPTAPENTAGDLAASLDYVLAQDALILAQIPSTGRLPAYQYTKVHNVQNIPSTWTRLVSVPVIRNEIGAYEPGFAVEWMHTTQDALLYLRISLDGGSTWVAYTKRNTDPTNPQTFFYQFPVEVGSTDGVTIVLEARKGTTETGTLDVLHADAWWRQVRRDFTEE